MTTTNDNKASWKRVHVIQGTYCSINISESDHKTPRYTYQIGRVRDNKDSKDTEVKSTVSELIAKGQVDKVDFAPYVNLQMDTRTENVSVTSTAEEVRNLVLAAEHWIKERSQNLVDEFNAFVASRRATKADAEVEREGRKPTKDNRKVPQVLDNFLIEGYSLGANIKQYVYVCPSKGIK